MGGWLQRGGRPIGIAEWSASFPTSALLPRAGSRPAAARCDTVPRLRARPRSAGALPRRPSHSASTRPRRQGPGRSALPATPDRVRASPTGHRCALIPFIVGGRCRVPCVPTCPAQRELAGVMASPIVQQFTADAPLPCRRRGISSSWPRTAPVLASRTPRGGGGSAGDGDRSLAPRCASVATAFAGMRSRPALARAQCGEGRHAGAVQAVLDHPVEVGRRGQGAVSRRAELVDALAKVTRLRCDQRATSPAPSPRAPWHWMQ